MKKIVTLAWATLLILSLTLTACSAAPSQAAPTESPAVPTAPPPTEIPTPTPTPTPTAPVLGTYELLAPEDMRADLDELFARLHNNHPDPYLWRPKAEVDIDYQRVYDELSQPLSMVEYYKKVAPLVNSLGDDHTYVALPDDVFQVIIQQELLFTLGVQIQNQRAYVTENASGNDEILAGAEILSMNGIPMPDILAEIKGYLPFSRIVQPHYFWYVFGSLEEYTLEVKLPGQESPVTHTVPGLDIMTIMQNMQLSDESPAAPPEPVTYTRLPEDETIGVLRIDSFIGLDNFVKPAFAQIQQDGIQHLIIDVRANGGGMKDQVYLVMNFLTDQPYRHCSKHWKAPAGGYGSEATRRESACESQQPIEHPERYQGKRYLLVGQKTFSAAITFSTILQDSSLAVLLGEETLAPASFCAEASRELASLPRTGLGYLNSHTCFVRPSGEADWQRGVVPDFIVETSIADMLSGHDPVLEYTLELIRSGE
jgi:hypothetical protein